MSGADQLHFPHGTLTAGVDPVHLTAERAGWQRCVLDVLELAPGEARTVPTGDTERFVLPLSGAFNVTCDGRTLELSGRVSVFTRVTDFAYVPRDAEVTVASAAGGRFALPAARATKRLTARYGPAEGVQVELRGAGQASRQVNNFCNPASFEAEKLIAVEVLTPESNWSSYPPHKHDQDRDGESVLEEIYYFEVGSANSRGRSANSPGEMANSRVGVGYQRVYGSGPGREIDVCTEVRTGDTVLIPHGWHGPSMAAPGYDLYYLNVMAGPSPDRAWLICDDPAHAWVRGTWDGQDIDPRLPMTGVESR